MIEHISEYVNGILLLKSNFVLNVKVFYGGINAVCRKVGVV